MNDASPNAQINLAALKHNLSVVKQYAPQSRVMSVIKSNAYGHGVLEVAAALQESDAFAVARLAEGLQLREAGETKPILLLEGVTNASELEQAAAADLSLVFHTHEQLMMLVGTSLAKSLTFCWVKVDTGMHRLGFSPDHALSAWKILNKSNLISGDVGMMSHFSNADVLGDPKNVSQQALFSGLITQDTDLAAAPKSMANSAAILSQPDSHLDWVRPGLMLYGISPIRGKTAEELGLKPVMTVSGELISIQNLLAGDTVGYGSSWECPTDMRVGLINIGYGDGYPRQLSMRGTVLVKGIKSRVLGHVSMDMICVDLCNQPDAKVGDSVTLWGDDLPVEMIAEQANTIGYELVCQLTQRVPRFYKDA
jgi:alanine racemase